MNGVMSLPAVFVGKRWRISLYGTMELLQRNFGISRVWHSNVNDIRRQMDIKQRDRINDATYRDGQYLVMDTLKGRVLLSRTSDDSKGKSLLWTRYNELRNFGVKVEENAVFLRIADGDSKFAVNVASLPENQLNSLEIQTNGKFMLLRASLFNLDGSSETALVSQSHSLLDWKEKYKFCVHCGGTLENELSGMQKRCCGCKIVHYPMINPVSIALVCNEQNNKVLLVRQPVHPPKMFTCIAGFIESGETIEESIKREVAEEVGLHVSSIQYIGSQHWSLPASRLMIGCFATVRDENFLVDTVELEEACWFSSAQIKDALKRVTEKKEKVLKSPEDIWIPPAGAIAHSLIKLWLQKCHET